MRAAGDAGVMESGAEDICSVAAAAIAVVHDQGNHDSARVARAVIDVFPGLTGPLPETRHTIPRHRAAGTDVSAPPGRPEVEHMGEGAAADAIRKNEGTKRMRRFEEMNGFANDGFPLDSLISCHAGGENLSILSGSSPGEVEFIANLDRQVGSAGENREKYGKYENG